MLQVPQVAKVVLDQLEQQVRVQQVPQVAKVLQVQLDQLEQQVRVQQVVLAQLVPLAQQVLQE